MSMSRSQSMLKKDKENITPFILNVTYHIRNSINFFNIFLFSQCHNLSTASTSFHGQELGFRTALIDDCSRGIQTDAIRNTIEKVRSNHGVVVQSDEVSKNKVNMVFPMIGRAHLYGN